jgi:hypothetical protein
MPQHGKFGKRPPELHPDTLWLDAYLNSDALPPPEEKRGWEWNVPGAIWANSMLGNDQVENCVEAMILHYIMMAQASTGKPVTQFTEQDGINLYSWITGYVPGDESTDNGTGIVQALNHWRVKGVFGHHILGYMAFNWNDQIRMNQAIDIFGASLTGLNVTPSMVNQFDAGQPWNAPFDGNPDGHGVPITGYGSQGRTCITWAAHEQMDFQATGQFDEAFVVITDDWLTKAKTTPILGLNLARLERDLNLIAG